MEGSKNADRTKNMPPSLACSWLLKGLKNMRWHHTQTLPSSLMAPNMQHSTSKQQSPSSPVIDDYHGVSDVPSSPTIISPDDPNIIPGTNSNRTLVVCFDGTGDQFDTNNSNVVKLFSMLVKKHPSQKVYYQAGIGTYTIPEIATPLMANISKKLDMMTGRHLDSHVMGGYEFLMQNYELGDKICVFGFSRGAYTARALVGMVDQVGLIPRDNHQQVPFAYHMYSRDDKTGWEQSTAFKKAFSLSVDIEFVGVWDTVSALGIIPKRLPFARTDNCVKYFRHALSLDERRVRFKQSTWERMNARNTDLSGATSNGKSNVEEVWFAGCHCDVGGGSVSNDTRNSLARIPLRWMIREIFKAEVGILFHREMFKDIGMDPEMLCPVQKRPDIIYHQSPSTSIHDSPNSMVQSPPKLSDPADIYSNFVSEEQEDIADAISPKNDELRRNSLWWILEVLPQQVFYQDDNDNHDAERWTVNLGGGRYIPRPHIDRVKIHRSVKIRMNADCLEDGKYKPEAKLGSMEPEWID